MMSKKVCYLSLRSHAPLIRAMTQAGSDNTHHLSDTESEADSLLSITPHGAPHGRKTTRQAIKDGKKDQVRLNYNLKMSGLSH